MTTNEQVVVTVIGGNTYTVWHHDGKITHTACVGRWPKSSMATGSDWLDEQLNKAVKESLEESQ